VAFFRTTWFDGLGKKV